MSPRVALFGGVMRTLQGIWRASMSWPVIIIGAYACAICLLLSRYEFAVAVRWAGVVFSPFFGITAVMGVLILASMVSRWRPATLILLGYLLLVFSIAAVQLIISGYNSVWWVHSVLGFTGPVILGAAATCLRPTAALNIFRLIVSLVGMTAVLLVAVVIAGFLVSAIVGWSRAFPRGVTPIGGPIATGALILLVLPSVTLPLVNRGTRNVRTVGIFSVLLLAILLTGSRVIAAIGVAAIAFTIATALLNAGRQRSPVRVILRVLMVASVSVVVALQLVGTMSWERLRMGIGAGGGDELRLKSLLTARALVSEAPLLGHGPGQVYTWFRYTGRSIGDPVQYHDGMVSLIEPHNMLAMLAVEYGMIVAVATLAFLIIFVLVCYRAGAARNDDILLAQAIGVASFLLQTIGSSHLLVNHRVAVIFWLFVGVTAVRLSWIKRVASDSGMHKRRNNIQYSVSA